MNFAPFELDADTLEFWHEAHAFFDEHVTDTVRDKERDRQRVQRGAAPGAR